MTRYCVDQIEGLFPVDTTHRILDVVNIDGDTSLILQNIYDQTELSMKVEDIYFNTSRSCPYGYYIEYVEALGCDDSLEKLSPIGNDGVQLIVVETNGVLSVHDDVSDDDISTVIHVKQISFIAQPFRCTEGQNAIVNASELYYHPSSYLKDYPWLDIVWNKVKCQFILVSRCLGGKMVDDVLAVIKLMCLMIEDRQLEIVYRIF